MEKEKMDYQIVISAPAKNVWETMLQKETYMQWTAESWPGSTFKGKWGKGEKISFVGPDGSGTLAEIVEFKPHEYVLARHIAVLGKNGAEDRTSDMAKDWVGTTEAYTLREQNGKTEVTVTIECPPAWKAMFDEGWPGALEALKRLTEQQLVRH